MNFKQWIEATGVVESPWKALQILNITDKAGSPISHEELMQAYRASAKGAHPDLEGGSNETMKFINAAVEILTPYTNTQTPLPHQPNPNQKTFWVDTPKPQPAKRDRPIGSQDFTAKQVEEFTKQLIDINISEIYIKSRIERMPFSFGSICDLPLGSKERKTPFQGNSDNLLKFIFDTIEKDHAEYPKDIICMKLVPNAKDAYGWITYIFYKDRSWERSLGAYVGDYYLRTIEFIAPRKKTQQEIDQAKKIKTEALKTKPAITQALKDNGLIHIPTSGEIQYFGLTEHLGNRTPIGYLVEITKRMFKIVKRYRDLSDNKIRTIAVDSKPFGQVTPNVIRAAANWVRKRYEQRGLGEKDDENL